MTDSVKMRKPAALIVVLLISPQMDGWSCMDLGVKSELTAVTSKTNLRTAPVFSTRTIMAMK